MPPSLLPLARSTSARRLSTSALRARVFGLVAALGLLATACAVDVSQITRVPDAAASSATSTEALASLASSDCPTGLTNDGAALLGARLAATGNPVPVYQLEADIDPATGHVDGTLVASIPADDDRMRFRVFAGMDAFNSGLSITNVMVDGDPVEHELDRSLLTIENPAGAASTSVTMDFDFTIDQMAANENLLGALTGDTLQPDQVGLLGRTETGMQLGHWFPVWMPNGTRTDPDPSGFGDIGAFAAAAICANVTVPADYTVITSGARFSPADAEAGTTVVSEAATGIRDFAMLISNDIEMLKGTVQGVDVRVWGPSGDREALQTALDYSLVSQQALHDAFGPYPWTEIDVVSAPLGGGVGGMEWPGMVWIERSLFAGGIPGLGGLGGLGDLFENDLFEDLLGGLGGEALDSTLEWTIAHELGHEWFHAVVGNDSIASPAVDEPLAQFAACVAMREIHPDNWEAICDAQTTDQFAQARALGVDDAPADQASDEFDSALQYGAVVYGKAPGFYFEAADIMGWDALIDALAGFVEANAFSLVGTDVLRDHLVAAAGDDGPAINDLWERWFSQAKGDEDIEATDLFGGLGGGLFGEDLFGEDLFGEDLFGEGGPSLDELFGDGELDLDDFMSDFFGEDSPFGQGFLDENGEPNLDDFFGEGSPLGDGSIFEYLDDGELSEDELNQLLEDLLGG